MPDQIDDILMGLRDHAEMPPGFLTDRLLQAIDGEGKQHVAFYLRLSSLQEYSIEPPASHLAIIKERLFTAVKTNTKSGSLVSLARYAVAAAAVLLLFSLGWLFYKKNSLPSTEKKDMVNMVKESAKESILAGDSVHIYKDSVATLAGKVRNNGRNEEFRSKMLIKNFVYSEKIMPVGQNVVRLADNDILNTIIACNYKMLAPYLEDNAPKMVVNIDQYSSVTINKKMIEFMRVMYKTKRNEKPTAKARRAKANLVKWKKKDESYFNGPSKTALDIMDLGEFVIEKN
jgi:hypothetical protein